MKLYRYRKAELYSIDELYSNSVQFTKYSAFINYGELDYFTCKQLLMIKASDKDIEGFTNSIKNNVLVNYYMACFSTKGPFDNDNPKAEYSGKNGFCLVYDLDSIMESIRFAYKKRQYCMEIRPVIYSRKKYDLSPIANELIKVVVDSGTQTEVEKENVLKEFIENGKVENKACDCVVNSFFQKKLAYKKDSEYRIVLQNKGENRERIILAGFTLKPSFIYISKQIPLLIFTKIVHYCEINSIRWSYM